jgi:DNA (cytosine-5)-methyltransferase 1
MENNSQELCFLDLFAGAGGMSEGFIRAGFSPVAHVESNKAACLTLKTRTAYHWLKERGQLDVYWDYLSGRITRNDLYGLVPKQRISSVVNAEITKEALHGIFQTVDSLLLGKQPQLIIGGPPCQAYSVVGRSRDKNGMLGDKRNYLYEFYAQFLAQFKPQYFVFENVTGLLSARDERGGRYLDKMVNLFREVGYETEMRTLSADEYGVLQQRRRVILVGNSAGKKGYFPDPEPWKPGVFVNEVLSDLPPIKAGEGSMGPVKLMNYTGSYLKDSSIRIDDDPVALHSARPHSERDLEIYRIVVEKWDTSGERLRYNALPEYLKTHANEVDFADRFKVVAGNLPASQTVVAHIARDGHYYIHPDINQNRSLTPREAARLQTFPDNYYFENEPGKFGRTAPFRQIGNAVPVLLAQRIAESLMKTW